jgi:hypothetical protein
MGWWFIDKISSFTDVPLGLKIMPNLVSGYTEWLKKSAL